MKSLADNVAALSKRNDELASTLREAGSRLDGLAATVAELQKVAHASAAGADRAVRLAVAASSLQGAVERGDPFAAELAVAEQFTADPNMLAPLKPFAAAGVPSAAALMRELSKLIQPMLSAERAAAAPRAGDGFLDRLQANAERLVRIRPIDEAPPEKIRRGAGAHRSAGGALRRRMTSWPNSTSCRNPSARRRSPGSPRSKRATRRWKPPDDFPPTPLQRSNLRQIDDPRHCVPRIRRLDRVRRGLDRRPSRRRRHHLAGLAHRDLGDGGGGRHRRCGHRCADAVVAVADRPAHAGPDRDVPEPSPRRARLSRDFARPGRGRRGRRCAPRARPPTRPSGSRPASRWRFCSTPSARSCPATAPPPSWRSAPWPSATTPSCSVCAGSTSRRSVAAMPWRRKALPRRPPRPRRRCHGRGRRCSICAARPATGTGALASARPQQPARADRQGAAPAPARGAVDRPALAAEENDPDRARSLALDAVKLEPDAGAGGRACRTAARRGRRNPPRQPDHREGLAGQSASRARRRLCASAQRRFGARAVGAGGDAGAADARPPREPRSRWRAPRSTRTSSRWRAKR